MPTHGTTFGEYSLEYIFFKSSKKVLKFLNFSLCYYVEVYVKDFKIYVIFKSFEVYL